MKFTIDRSKWRCGGTGKNAAGLYITQLLNEGGFMCCLGQVAVQLGCPREKLLGVGGPCGVRNDGDTGEPEPHLAGVLQMILPVQGGVPVPANTPLSEDAMDTNDNECMTRDEREQSLVALFHKHGHEIEFTGEYVNPPANQPVGSPHATDPLN